MEGQWMSANVLILCTIYAVMGSATFCIAGSLLWMVRTERKRHER